MYEQNEDERNNGNSLCMAVRYCSLLPRLC